MIRFSQNILTGLFVLTLLFFTSCEKNELDQVEKNVLPKIYITNSVNGRINVNINNAVIDKSSKTITTVFGVSRSGIQEKEAFSVDVRLSSENLPPGTIGLTPGQYSFSASALGSSSVEHLQIEKGSNSAPLFLTISKTVLDENQGKLLAINVILSNPTKFTLNTELDTVAIVVDVNSFAEKAINITNTYIKNPGGVDTPFKRSDSDNTRFGLLKDWLINDAVKNIDNRTRGGFDSYNGGAYMAMERWGTPEIPNGKISQNVILPEGKYRFEVDFESSGISNLAYIAVSDGNTLPNVADIASTIAYTTFGNPRLEFILEEEKSVSLGIVANLINDFQWFRARGVKLWKFEGAFD